MIGKDEATPEEMREAENAQMGGWEDDGGAVPEPAKGAVQSTKDILAEKEVLAHEGTPEGMQFVGWLLDGWVAPYPLLDANARPVYAFPREF